MTAVAVVGLVLAASIVIGLAFALARAADKPAPTPPQPKNLRVVDSGEDES